MTTMAELTQWMEIAADALGHIREALENAPELPGELAPMVAEVQPMPEDSMALNPEKPLPEVEQYPVIESADVVEPPVEEVPAIEKPEPQDPPAPQSDVDAILEAAAVPQVSAETIAELLQVAERLGMTPEEFTQKTKQFFEVDSLEQLPATGPKSAEVLMASMQKRLSYGAA